MDRQAAVHGEPAPVPSHLRWRRALSRGGRRRRRRAAAGEEPRLLAAYDSVRNHITIKFNHPETQACSTKIDKRLKLAEQREASARQDPRRPVQDQGHPNPDPNPNPNWTPGQFKIKDTTRELVEDDKALSMTGYNNLNPNPTLTLTLT